jgi:hypothetical protein
VFALVESSALLPHEEVEDDRFRALAGEILHDGFLRHPVLVDSRSMVILDGHHRVAVLRTCGCHLIPAYLVDYASPAVRVYPRRSDIPVSKDLIVQRALAHSPLPPRSSRHVLDLVLLPKPVELKRLQL